MDLINKPRRAVRRLINRVSIQTLMKNGEGDEVEPFGITRGSSRAWAEPMQEDMRDPKNWRAWKKDFAFISLLVSAAVVGTLKTLFVTTNSVIAIEYNVSYTSAATLTGVPFIVASLSSLGGGILSQVIGKRAIHLGATLLMLAGTVWNMHAMGSYMQFMFARILQGVGWGTFESIVMISIRDIFHPHELPLCCNILSITSLLFTWASPILGGYLSQGTSSFRPELLVVVIIQAASILFAFLFFPEPSFKRSNTDTSPAPGTAPPPPSYISSLSLLPYSASFTRESLQPIRALAAPSVLLGFLLAGPLLASAFGLANSLSLLFTSFPVLLFPTQLGFLFTLPACLSVVGATIITVMAAFSRAAVSPYRVLVPGMIIGLAGLLSFGLYTILAFQSRDQADPAFSLNLLIVSLLLALLISGAAFVGSAMKLYLSTLSCQTSQAVAEVRDKEVTDMERASRAWIDILTGILIIAIPAFANSHKSEGAVVWLKDVVIAMAVVQVAACLVVGSVSWLLEEKLNMLDARVLGINSSVVDVRGRSFFNV